MNVSELLSPKAKSKVNTVSIFQEQKSFFKQRIKNLKINLINRR